MNARIDLVPGQNCVLPTHDLHIILNHAQNPPDIEVRLDSHRDDQFTCAIAMLENINHQLCITKLLDYFSGHQHMDCAYGWGLNYVAGSK
ncbi:MAG: hypothetical protein WAW36_15945 [Methylovulum miyakonense]|uniref:hypothetical protein n=1 Tax=Methylovulum miyakonense TaxID=645578 RepID=UPI003BB741A6